MKSYFYNPVSIKCRKFKIEVKNILRDIYTINIVFTLFISSVFLSSTL